MKNAGTTRTRTPAVGSWRGTKRRLVAALAALALAMFGFGSLVSPAHAKEETEVTPKIIGGSVAPNGSWPSQTALLAASVSNPYNAQFCGGTLIAPYWVLTAAHCVTDENRRVARISAIQVAIGINDLSDISASDRIGLASIKVIPTWSPASFSWDFALLELATRSNQPAMQVIAPGEEMYTAGGQPASIAGWGCTLQVPKSVCGTSGGLPVKLREASVNFVSDADCTTSWGSLFDSDSMICAGIYPTGGKDTCFGDSGGPLTASVEGNTVVAGVTSWGGETCGRANEPGVYARVLAGRDWILKTLAGKRTGPTVFLKVRPAKRALRRKATFRFRASQSGSTFKCRLDGRSWRKCKSPKTYKNLKRGRKHAFRVRASKDGLTGPVKLYRWYVKRR